MRLESLRITNFKSLKDATFTPESLAVVVGPNNSGKSNLASAFKFLSEVYEYGLETAVRRSGGYENIAFRRKRRSKAAIEFEVLIKIEDERKIPSKFNTQIFSEKVLGNQMQAPFHFQHKFSIQATQQNINADFKIVDERFAFYSENGGQIIYYLQITRKPDGDLDIDTKLPLLGIFSSIGTKQLEVAQYFSVKDEQSLLTDSFYFDRNIPFKSIIRNWSAYQFNPSTVRSEGVPTPNPTIDRYGNNLPALVDWLSKKHKKEWETVLNAIRIIIPGLQNITTGYLYNKTLGLLFTEEGVEQPWTAEEVSDGTILTLAMLCAVADPRKTLVFIEEPENSVHPWIIREILAFLNQISKNKNIVITTHSPTIIDSVHPAKIWTIARTKGVSELQRLIDLDSKIERDWENGEYKISEFIDSGLIPKIVPS